MKTERPVFPIGLDRWGREWDAGNAPLLLSYRCPDCGGVVHPVHPEDKVPHFRHEPPTCLGTNAREERFRALLLEVLEGILQPWESRRRQEALTASQQGRQSCS